MKQEIIILGDIEMGAGTLTDDFIADKPLAKFIKHFAKKSHPVDLVLNGDTLDFLKCPYFKDGKEVYPRHITDEISLQKTQSMYKAHKPVFKALAEFVKKKNNRLYFIIGNHDHDLTLSIVQKELEKILKSKSNVFFTFNYEHMKVYAEHGQQYDFLNQVNRSQLYMTHRGKPILNLPWVSFGLMSNFMFIKEKHPFLERIVPYPLLFSAHKPILHKLIWEGSIHECLLLPYSLLNRPNLFIS